MFQEPISNDDYPSDKATNSLTKNDEQQISPNSHTTVTNSTENVTPSSSLTSLIKVIIFFLFLKVKKKLILNSDSKVSPLKSLLREDLKRRISARASSRASRNNGTQNSANNSENLPSTPTTSNGTITSTGNETDILLGSRKRNLQCLFCGIEFPDQTLYFLHKGCHSESNPW